jgi:hypothetical protein
MPSACRDRGAHDLRARWPTIDFGAAGVAAVLDHTDACIDHLVACIVAYHRQTQGR